MVLSPNGTLELPKKPLIALKICVLMPINTSSIGYIFYVGKREEKRCRGREREREGGGGCSATIRPLMGSKEEKRDVNQRERECDEGGSCYTTTRLPVRE